VDRTGVGRPFSRPGPGSPVDRSCRGSSGGATGCPAPRSILGPAPPARESYKVAIESRVRGPTDVGESASSTGARAIRYPAAMTADTPDREARADLARGLSATPSALRERAAFDETSRS